MAAVTSNASAEPVPAARPRKALIGRIWWQIMHTSGARMLALLASMATLAITARQLGPAGRGIVAAATNWTAMFAAFGGLSLAQVAIHRAAGREHAAWAPETVGAMLALLGVTTLCGWTIAAVGYAWSAGGMFTHLDAPVLLLAMLALPCIIWIDYGSSILMALDALSAANLAQVIGSVLALALVLLLVAGLHLGVLGAVGGTTLSMMTIAVLILRAVRLRIGALRLRWQPAREILWSGAKLHLNAIGTFFFSQASVLIVNRFRPATETGYFQLATQLVSVLAIIPTAVGMVAYTIVAQKGPDGAWAEQRRLLVHAVLGTVALAGIAYVFAPLGVMIVAGRAFLDAVPLFRIMLLGLVGMTCSSVMASQWIGRGFFTLAALTSLGVGVISVLGTNFAVQRYGIRGAAWMSVLVYSIAIVGNGLMAVWIERRPDTARGPDAPAGPPGGGLVMPPPLSVGDVPTPPDAPG